MNIAQSAASHAITALETRHDTKLFDRVGRRIELTEAGQVFLAEARAVLARAEAAELALGEFGSLKRGTLSVQASQTIANYWLPRHLVAFRRAYPQIEIRFTIGNTMQVAAAIESGMAKLGFVEGAVESANLTSAPLARDQLVVVAPGHPWVDRARLTPGDLKDGDWVMREPGAGTPIGLRGGVGGAWRRSRRVARPIGAALQRVRRASRWRRVWAPPPSPPRSPPPASKPVSCIRWRVACRSGTSMFCAIASAIKAVPRMRCWRSWVAAEVHPSRRSRLRGGQRSPGERPGSSRSAPLGPLVQPVGLLQQVLDLLLDVVLADTWRRNTGGLVIGRSRLMIAMVVDVAFARGDRLGRGRVRWFGRRRGRRSTGANSLRA